MWQADPVRLAEDLSRSFGLHLEGKGSHSSTGEFHLELVPVGVHPNESFKVLLLLGWRSLHAAFVPGAFASHLISEMGLLAPTRRTVFSKLAEQCHADHAKLQLKINGTDTSTNESVPWPDLWRSLELSLAKTPLGINTEDYEENDRQLTRWARRFTGLVLTLIPLEETEEMTELNPEGLPEGNAIRVMVNRYERNPSNRAACLEIHGTSCLACGFNFEQTYGLIGEGFIHVHHVTPVSQMGAGYIVDPANDLVPLCPNCHAMAHRNNPPLTVSEIKSLLLSEK
jgi:5-methylcytosine-specific restriction enzyme A